MDEITAVLEVEKDVYNNEYEDVLRGEFLHKFGKDMKVDIKIVDKIPRESSGKYRMIKNNV